MEKDTERIFYELKEDVSAYVRLKYKLLKLDATERIARLIAILSHGVILLLLLFFTILFLFLSLGFFLGDWLGSIALGFLAVGGISLLFTLVFYIGKDKVREKIMNGMIGALWTDEKTGDEN